MKVRVLVLVVAGAATACARAVPDTTAVISRGAVTVVDRGSVMSADALRTGWYSDEPQLDPITVGSPYFGQVFDAAVDGQIFAQPLYSNGIVFVATETNRVYALDAATGAVNWTRQVATPWQASDIGCSTNPAPNVGITGTPAIDPTTQTAYFFSKTYATGTSGAALWAAHAVDLSTGAERANFPVQIAGAANNDASQIFNPTQQLQRPGLLLMDGVVYAAFGSLCDLPPYTGWIVGVSTTGAIKAMWTTEAGPTKSIGGGIWMSGGGLVSDGDGQIVFATGNDNFVATTPIAGHQPPMTLGESIVRLAVQADGTLAATDFFSPVDTPALNQNDADLGAGAPIALPANFATAAYPKLLVEAGKQGYLYLFDGANLGGYLQGTGGSDQVLQRIGPNGGVWSKPSVWPGDGGYLYIPVVNGCAGPSNLSGCLRAYQYGTSGDGSPTLSASAESTSSFGYGSSAVVVTSDGTRSGSALLWTVWLAGSDSTTSQLRAYDAVPVGGALNLRYLVGVGNTKHFTPPAVGAGRVYVGTGDGHVLGFGVTGTPALRAQGVAFAPTLVGETLVSNVQVIASGPVEVVALSASGDFALTAAAPGVPFNAAAGDTIDIPVAFRPTAEGADVGALQVTTNEGTFTIPLTGVGQSSVPQLAASPSVVAFAPLVMGTTAVETVSMTNVSAAPMTISSTSTPSAPFSIAGLPADGTVVPSGGSFTVTITFAPASVGSSSSFFSVTASGAIAAVAVEGSALGGGKLRIAPQALDMGSMYVGTSLTSVFQLTNTGDVPVVIEKSQPPISPTFAVGTTLPEGTIIAPGASVQELIRVSPTAIGPTNDVWRINANDGQGLREVTLTVTGVAAPIVTTSAGADAGTEAMTVESNDPTVDNEESPPPGSSDEVVGHACSAAGTTHSPHLLGLGLVAAALVLSGRRRRQ